MKRQFIAGVCIVSAVCLILLSVVAGGSGTTTPKQTETTPAVGATSTFTGTPENLALCQNAYLITSSNFYVALTTYSPDTDENRAVFLVSAAGAADAYEASTIPTDTGEIALSINNLATVIREQLKVMTPDGQDEAAHVTAIQEMITAAGSVQSLCEASGFSQADIS